MLIRMYGLDNLTAKLSLVLSIWSCQSNLTSRHTFQCRGLMCVIHSGYTSTCTWLQRDLCVQQQQREREKKRESERDLCVQQQQREREKKRESERDLCVQQQQREREKKRESERDLCVQQQQRERE